jgi:Dipeptidyl aminopeptidases/acylaminoacyl-peptidases
VDAKTLVQPEMRPQRKRLPIYLIVLLVLIAVNITGVFGVSANVGWQLTHPVRQPVDETPQSAGLPFTEVSFSSRGDGLNLKGWFIPAQGSTKTVIFAHGYRKNRLQNDVPGLPLAQALAADHYNVLMFDFRNSGESDGKLTSVGQYEVQDLLGAVDFIQSKPEISSQIVLMGFSMGAATAILAGAREPAVTAVIADSPFADLKTYLNQNLSVWTELPSFPFNQAFFMIVPVMTGLDMNEVSPVKEVKNLGGHPLLLIHGTGDQDIPIENSEDLQQAYPQAQLLRVPGATHVKNYETDPGLYLSTVTSFLAGL